MSTYGPRFDSLSAFIRNYGRCSRCGRTFSPSELDAHHIRPRAEGGPDTYGNLVALCDSCHPIVERETQRSVDLLVRPRPRLRRRRLRPPDPPPYGG